MWTYISTYLHALICLLHVYTHIYTCQLTFLKLIRHMHTQKPDFLLFYWHVWNFSNRIVGGPYFTQEYIFCVAIWVPFAPICACLILSVSSSPGEEFCSNCVLELLYIGGLTQKDKVLQEEFSWNWPARLNNFLRHDTSCRVLLVHYICHWKR